MITKQVVPREPGRTTPVSVVPLVRVALGSTLVCAMVGPSESAAQHVDTLGLLPASGALENHEGFTDIRSVRELPDGRLLVTDREDPRLVVVDWESSEVKQISRKGQGPGEYEAPGRLYALADDTTLLTDFVSRRWFLVEGVEIVSTIPATDPGPRTIGPAPGGVDRDGRVLAVEGYLYTRSRVPGGRPNADSLRADLVSGAIEGELTATTIARLGGRARFGLESWSDGPYRYHGPNPLASEDQVLLFPDGWIAIAWGDPYRVDWRSPDGTWAEGDPLPFRATAVDGQERCFLFERHGRSDTCGDDLWAMFPEELPPFLPDALIATPEGRLLVERTPSAEARETRYDLIDRRGNLVGALVLPENQAVVGFGPESVYVATTDELDLQWLSRHPWSPGQ